MIARGEYIGDDLLVETLGAESLIVVPLEGGGERHLPSGEILSVLASAAGLGTNEVLERSFRMSPNEVETANAFIRLVQFAGDEPTAYDAAGPEQPFQGVDH